jgi:hypothetical protein
MDDRLFAVRKRLRDDYRYYAEHALQIRTKAGTFEKLRFNDAQLKLHAAIEKQQAKTGKIRVIILKGRQQGMSTYVGGRMIWRVAQQKARRAMVITHHADSTRALFDMTKRYYENLPDVLKPQSKYSSRRELSLAGLDSSYIVATSGGDSVGRGETLTDLHVSELAFWKPNQAADNWNGLEQAVPNAPGTSIFIESTANGVAGLFYNIWKGAVEGTNGFLPVFIPWYMSDEYRTQVPDAGIEVAPEESLLVEKYGLDQEQLVWRRNKIALNGLDLTRQEYPTMPDEAFLTTGRPVFIPERLVTKMEARKAPLTRMALVGSEAGGFAFEKDIRGDLACYAEHDPAETYYIGADVAMGVRGGDYSVAQVMDSRKRVVATYRAHVHPDYFAQVLNALGHLYNEARIIVESNNHGILTCSRLGKDLGYPNFYTEMQIDRLTQQETVKLGFSVNVKTKPLIIDELRASLREEEIALDDETTIRELMTYIVTEEGRMEADAACHDDTVIALALANHINEGYVEPITNMDEWYVEQV